MIEIKKIMENPYLMIKEEFDFEKYKVKCVSQYYGEGKDFGNIDIRLKCTLKDKMSYGEVQIAVEIEKFRKNGESVFSHILVPSEIERLGVGLLLMDSVIKIIKDFGEYFGVPTKKIRIEGFLSASDCANGNWNVSLPFYEKVAKKNDISVIFREKESGREYMKWQDYYEIEANKDGDIIFKL